MQRIASASSRPTKQTGELPERARYRPWVLDGGTSVRLHRALTSSTVTVPIPHAHCPALPSAVGSALAKRTARCSSTNSPSTPGAPTRATTSILATLPMLTSLRTGTEVFRGWTMSTWPWSLNRARSGCSVSWASWWLNSGALATAEGPELRLYSHETKISAKIAR